MVFYNISLIFGHVTHYCCDCNYYMNIHENYATILEMENVQLSQPAGRREKL